jgi:hypothetical protein
MKEPICVTRVSLYSHFLVHLFWHVRVLKKPAGVKNFATNWRQNLKTTPAKMTKQTKFCATCAVRNLVKSSAKEVCRYNIPLNSDSVRQRNVPQYRCVDQASLLSENKTEKHLLITNFLD